MQSSPAAAAGPLPLVLAYEAALPRGSPPVCVAIRPEGTAFDEARRDIRSIRESRPDNPRDAWHRLRFLSDHEHRRFDWRLPLPVGERGDAALPPPLDPRQAEALSAATWPLLSG